jgi:succinoglycan biosynthesis protein ExoM
MIRLNVCICTFRRDEMLRGALAVLADAYAAVGDVRLRVRVVDDFGAGTTEAMLSSLDLPFPVTYVKSASRNISIARNAGIAAALPDSDWVGMLDDDVVVSSQWLTVAREWMTGAPFDALSGPVITEASHGPKWLDEAPFQEVKEWIGADGCATANCLLRTAWLEQNPDVRFDPALGVSGGEDMVFFGTAVARGLRVKHLARMRVLDVVPPSRLTFRYHLHRALWIGNSEAITNLELGRAARGRLLLRGAKRLVTAATLEKCRLQTARPYVTVRRYPLIVALQGVGLILGAVGIRLAHR